MVIRRVEVERPEPKDVHLTDIPAMSLDGKFGRCGGYPLRALLPPPIIELPKASVRGQISTVDTPPTCRAPAPAVDHAVEGLAEARASLKYNIAKVPSCYVTPDGIPGSVVYPVLHRSQWERSTSELLALCHEAAERRAQKTGAFRGIHHDHAEAERMSLAFIQDRIDTDDPIRGYMIRSDDHRRRLQGFIWFTTFTSWTHFFKWDSKSPAAGLRGTADRHRIRWDSDNTLAWELEQQHRAGDPRAEGVIWSRVGEISLVGGLGCGGFLLQLALEEMEATGAYDYAVVQATESSAGFYDRMGFVRVGALARYVTPGADYRKAETVAYRHFAGPDEDVSALDSSIMMAIRLRPGCIPRRVLLRHGGIYSNLGTKVAVCLQHAGEAVLSVKNTAPSSPAESVEPPATERARGSPAACSPAACVHEKASAGAREEGLTVEGLLGSSAVVGPGASSHALQIMCQIIGRPDMEEASEGKEGERGKEAEGGREGRRASEFAKRRLSTWLNPKEAKKPWELYGTPPPVLAAADERAAAEARASTLGAPRGGARRRGRGRPAGSRRVAGGAEGAVRGGRGGEDSPGCRSAQETPRAEKKRKYQEVEDVAEAHAGAGGEHDVALLVLENVRKETLRVVCGDLALQISGSRSMLVGRVQELHQESLESARHCKGKEGKGCGAAGAMSALRAMGWLDSAELKLTTLELICCDLNLFKRGTKEDLRLRIFEHGQELAGEHEAGGEACGVSGAEEDACNSGGDMQGERMSLEALRKDTLRLVCYDLHLPFSGPKHILIPRLIRKLQTDRLAAGAESDDVSGWWLFNEAIKQATLQSACMDLGLGRQGSKPHMRRRILASVGTPLDDIEEGQDEEAGDDSEADERAAPAVAACAAEAAPVKKGRGRPRKRDAAEEVSNGRSVCGDCQHAQSPTSARGRTTAGAEANPWDAVECQRCGSTDREHKMILCDECDGGYHYDTCAYPRLYAIPRGNWYCYECQKRRKKAQRLEAMDQVSSPLGVAPSVLSVAKSGRERKATSRFRPRLGL